MAIDVFIGMNRGDALPAVVQSSSTTSKTLELQIDKAAWPDRGQLLASIEFLVDKLLQSYWPA